MKGCSKSFLRDGGQICFNGKMMPNVDRHMPRRKVGAEERAREHARTASERGGCDRDPRVGKKLTHIWSFQFLLCISEEKGVKG